MNSAQVREIPDGIEAANVIVWGDAGGFAQQIIAGPHRLAGDEPESAGGTGTGPSPLVYSQQIPTGQLQDTLRTESPLIEISLASVLPS